MNETPILLSNVRKGDTVMWGPFRLTAIEDTQAELPDGDKPAGRSCQFRTPLNKPYTLTERGGEQIPLIAAGKFNGETDPYELIRKERGEQMAMGFDQLHDDEHENGELANAAACYAIPDPETQDAAILELWPFEEDLKPSPSRIHELVKAGAMIVAEIERLQRVEKASA